MLILSSLSVSQEFQQSGMDGHDRPTRGQRRVTKLKRTKEDRREEHAMIRSCVRAVSIFKSPGSLSISLSIVVIFVRKPKAKQKLLQAPRLFVPPPSIRHTCVIPTPAKEPRDNANASGAVDGPGVVTSPRTQTRTSYSSMKRILPCHSNGHDRTLPLGP